MTQAIQMYVKKQLVWDVLMITLFGIWGQHNFMKRQQQASSEE